MWASVLLLAGFAAAVVVTVRLRGDDARQRLEDDDTRPNIVIVLVDTLRADHTSLHGYARDTTPNLRRIGEQGLVLRSHFVNAPWTKPSVASLITGLHPSAHGSRVGQFETLEGIEQLRRQGQNPEIEILNAKHQTLAEILGDAGYRTAAFLSNYHLTPKFGYAQGYDEYSFEPGAVADEKMVRSTTRFLRRSDGPAFGWCHLMSVHDYVFPSTFEKFTATSFTPFDSSAAQLSRVEQYGHLETAIASYDNAIAYADSLVGELFDSIVRYEPNTILIVTSDHGEEFFEHGGFEHVRTLYNELLHVPFVAWGPGVPKTEMAGITDSIDLLPTLLTNLDISMPDNLPGEVLFADGETVEGDRNRSTFAEQHHRGPFVRFSLLRRGKKLIVNQHKVTSAETVEFYTDGVGIEAHNRADDANPTDTTDIEAWRADIEGYRARADAQFAQIVGEAAFTDLSDYDIERLRLLGYVR